VATSFTWEVRAVAFVSDRLSASVSCFCRFFELASLVFAAS
jgi:hypothetical protein